MTNVPQLRSCAAAPAPRPCADRGRAWAAPPSPAVSVVSLKPGEDTQCRSKKVITAGALRALSPLPAPLSAPGSSPPAVALRGPGVLLPARTARGSVTLTPPFLWCVPRSQARPGSPGPRGAVLAGFRDLGTSSAWALLTMPFALCSMSSLCSVFCSLRSRCSLVPLPAPQSASRRLHPSSSSCSPSRGLFWGELGADVLSPSPLQ